jgi:hypothetical protein
MPRARECVLCTDSQTGTAARTPCALQTRTRGERGATNEVIAISRDQAKLRVEDTMASAATATRDPDRIGWMVPPEGRISGPSTGFEVTVSGRQGIRAKRDINPACGSADLF